MANRWLALAGVGLLMGAEPPRPIPVEQVTIEAAANGVEVRMPGMQARAARATFDGKAGTVVLEGTAGDPVVLTQTRPAGPDKVHSGRRITIRLKEGTIETAGAR